MVLLLRHLMCLVIESGFWFIESGVSIPVELVVCILPVSASCQIVLSASWFLQGGLPCWLLFILLVLSRYCRFTPGIGLLSGILSRCIQSAEARRPFNAIAFYSSVVIGDLVRDSYRDSVSRILDGNGIVASCGWMSLDMMKLDEE